MSDQTKAADDEQVDELAALLKAAGDPLRLEILRILQRDSYGVLELCRILDMRQSALSYQLKVLARAGLVATRKEGNTVFYRRTSAGTRFKGVLAELFAAADQLPLRAALQSRVTAVQAERTAASRQFFQRNASRFHEYQDLIASHHDYGEAIVSFMGSVVPTSAANALEVGPGEGNLLSALSTRFKRVTALELSSEMLEKSQNLADKQALANVRFVHGDTSAAVKQGLCADCITINMVLHHTPSPADVFVDLGQLLNPGGALLVTDLCRHDQNWAKESCGDQWLGFEPEDLTEWAGQAGLDEGHSQYLALKNGFKVQLRPLCKTRDVRWKIRDEWRRNNRALLFYLPSLVSHTRKRGDLMTEYTVFTSESVSEGHPDKMADQISDAILDAMLKDDPESRVAVETMVKTGMAVIAGEVRTSTYVDLEEIVRDVILDIGYNSSDVGFDGASCAVLNAIGKQSHDIAIGVDESDDKDQGAGDQGLMFGYATRETDTLMPAPIYYSHRLVERQAYLRKQNVLPWLRPDAKSQVTMRYDQNNRPVAIDAVVLSTQHDPHVAQSDIREAVMEEIIQHCLPAELLHADTQYHINPTGQFIIGGPVGDCGLTGRKIIVDTYGGMARHGGGAFSGKDPSKVDRSAAYAGRYVAKNIVAAGLAERCEIQVSYAIGVAEPTSISVNTFGTGKLPEAHIEALVRDHFDLRPRGIVEMLDLKRPIYRSTAAYGHFGREDADFTWERTDKADALKAAL